jgi:hypothetical protein
MGVGDEGVRFGFGFVSEHCQEFAPPFFHAQVHVQEDPPFTLLILSPSLHP